MQRTADDELETAARGGPAAAVASAEHGLNGPSSDALKIFISYSRADMAAADAMVEALEGNGFSVTIDRRDLPYGEEWQKELSDFIAQSDTVVWLVSPDSVKSKWVNWELGEVGRLSKRLIPVRIRDLHPDELPEALGKIHLLPVEGAYQAFRHEADLVRALNTDRAWLKKATSLGEDARDWIANGRDTARLMRGAELTEAEAWSVRAPREAPSPASEILELILASRRAQERRRRATLAGSLVAAIVATGLAATAVWFGLEARDQAVEAEFQRDVATRNEERAVEQATLARANETVSLAALSRVALSEKLPVEAVKLALAAWPRSGDDGRPTLKRTAESLAQALPKLREQLRLSGHGDRLHSASFSRDGKYIVTASADLTAGIWSATTGALITTLKGHERALSSAVFSPDGTRVVTASWDGSARVWNAATGAELMALRPKGEAWVNGADISPDGKLIGIAFGKTAILYDASTGAELQTIPHENEVYLVAFSPTGRFVLTTSGSSARVFDVATGEETLKLAHENAVTTARFSADGALIVTTTNVGRIARIWDAASGLERIALQAAEGHWFVSAGFSPDGGRIVAAMSKNDVRIWDATTGAELLALEGHDGPVYTAVFSPDGQRVVTASNDKTARVWNTAADPRPELLGGGEGWTLLPAYLPEGGLVVVVSANGTSAIVDPASDEQPVRLEGLSGEVASVSFSPDGTRLLAAEAFAEVPVWHAGTGKVVMTLKGHEASVTAAAFSRDGSRIVTGSRDQTARVWDSATGAEVAVLRGHVDAVMGAALSADGKRAVTAGDMTARVWDATTGAELAVMTGHLDVTFSVLFSPDGTRIVSTSADGTARVWDAATGEELFVLRPPGAPVGIAFSPDGTRIATGLDNGPVYVWDAATGAELLVLPGHQDMVVSAAFSPDGGVLATGSRQGPGRIWDVSGLEKGDAFEVACRRLGSHALGDVQSRYGLNRLRPICGDSPPLSVNWSKLQ